MVGTRFGRQAVPLLYDHPKNQFRNSGLVRPELRNIGTPSNRTFPNCARFTRSIYGLDEFSLYPKLSRANLTPTPIPQKSNHANGFRMVGTRFGVSRTPVIRFPPENPNPVGVPVW